MINDIERQKKVVYDEWHRLANNHGHLYPSEDIDFLNEESIPDSEDDLLEKAVIYSSEEPIAIDIVLQKNPEEHKKKNFSQSITNDNIENVIDAITDEITGLFNNE